MIPHFVDEQKAAMMNESKLELSVHDPDHRMDNVLVGSKSWSILHHMQSPVT